MNHILTSFLHLFFGKERELRVKLFHVLAITGLIICILMTGISIAGHKPLSAIINFGAGFVSLFLLIYSAKSGRYPLCYGISIAVIFFVLFPSLFFSSGGYQGGMPLFFVFAIVFTVYMLDGRIMLLITTLELLFYLFLFRIAYLRPEWVIPFSSPEAVLTDIIVGLITVSIALGSTMYVQMSMYQRQQRELELARKEAESASQAKSTFLANMSHELRTPIHMILGMNEIIRRESRSRQVREYADKIDETGGILLSLVDNVLDVSKIELGKMELVSAPYESDELLRTLELVGLTQCRKKNLSFHLQAAEGLPPLLLGDMAHVRQIGTNLLSNAAKYTENGGVNLTITQEVQSDNRITLCISVQDTGIGIAQEALPTLFDTFTRVELNEHHHIEGTGLGLAIVKKLTDLMGGTISVTSAVGAGSTFTVKIPQQIPENTCTVQQPQAVSFCAPDVRILAVDDNAGNRMLLQKLLEPTNLQLDLAASGPECLRLVHQNTYHAILLDYMMPGMDGLETMMRLCQLRDFHTPVIALTADVTTETEKKLLGGGFFAVLTKPFPWKNLCDILLACLPAQLVTLTVEQQFSSFFDREQDEKLRTLGIQPDVGMRYFSGGPEEYRAVAKIFLHHAMEEQQKLQQLLTAGDLKHLRFPLHALKGKARNLGMEQLAELCCHLENLCVAERSEELESLMPHLFYLWKQGTKGCQVILQSASSQEKHHSEPVPAIQPEQLTGLLRSFRRKPSLDVIHALLQEEKNAEGQQRLLEIEHLVEQIAFDQADARFQTYLLWKKGEKTDDIPTQDSGN